VRKLAISLVAVAVLLGLAYVLGLRGAPSLIYVGAALFCVVTNLWATIDYSRIKRWRLAGGPVAHVGLGLLLLAFLTTGWLGQKGKVRLTQDEPAEVLGYTLTFRGVEKPTPMARDAMVVEVSDPRGRNFVLKPRMWVNQKSNQLVANPDIKVFLTRDLYLAPVEYDPGKDAPVSASLMLTKDQPTSFRDWQLTFRRFDMSKQNAVPGALTVGMVIELARPGAEPVELEPSLISTNEGVQAIAVDIPGVPGGKLRVTGMSVDSGVVRAELVGLGGGVARTAVLAKGETMEYGDLRINFDDFDLSNFDPEAGKINIGAVFTVESGEDTFELEPTYRGNRGSAPLVTPAIVPGTGGITLNLGRIDAENGTVELQIIDPAMPMPAPTRASLVLDVSTKPLISLVWVGTVLVVIGIFMALSLRRKDLATIPIES
jgi:cytochrome c-type biogenesis protein CcmF